MEDYEIYETSSMLSEWNPLGDDAETVNDLDDYKTKSIHMLFTLKGEALTTARAERSV
jgi:hypothetical protein